MDNYQNYMIKISDDDACQFIVPNSASGEAHLAVNRWILDLANSLGWVRDITFTPISLALTTDEVECFYNDHAMYISWNSDNTDSKLQEYDYSLDDALRILEHNEGQIFYDGFNPEDDPDYNAKLEEFRKINNQEWIVGIYGTELNDIKFRRVKGNERKVREYLATTVLTDRENIELNNDKQIDEWISGTDLAEKVRSNPDGSLTAYGQYQNYNMTYTAMPADQTQVMVL